MTETSQELSNTMHFLSERSPAAPRWGPCSRQDKSSLKRKGHDGPTTSALLGDYEAYLCPDPTEPGGWTWVLTYSPRANVQHMVEDASGQVIGSESDAKARAETMARMFGGMVET